MKDRGVGEDYIQADNGVQGKTPGTGRVPIPAMSGMTANTDAINSIS